MKFATTLIASALAVSACSTGVRQEPPLIEATTLTVDNRSFLDMAIYVSRGHRVRLGIASAHGKTVFAIPQSLLVSPTQLRFIADPIGSSRVSVSEEIHVAPGDSVALLIPPA